MRLNIFACGFSWGIGIMCLALGDLWMGGLNLVAATINAFIVWGIES